MKTKIVLSLVLAFIILKGYAQKKPLSAQSLLSKPTLTVGSPAPVLEVQQWLKEAPIKQFEKGKLYVVEFWATWCAPCIQAMPHLSELARKYKDKMTFIGVSVWEDKKKPVPDAAALQAFVDKKGKDMDYVVAMDNPTTNKVADAWLKAARLNRIPTTFVVDRNGKIAWIGNPYAEDFESILEVLVNTPEKFDYNSAQENQNKSIKKEFDYQSQKLLTKLLAEKNYGQAWEEVQKFIKEYPTFETEQFSVFMNVYLNYNSKAAFALIIEKSKDTDFLKAKGGQNNIEATGEDLLNDFAKKVAGKTGLDYNLYCWAIERLNKSVQKNYNLWSLLGQAYASLGEFDKAISAQEKGIEAYQKSAKPAQDEMQAKLFEREKKNMTDRLAMYNDIKKKREVL